MEKIKVSIIVPVYNVSQYLSRCLESLINQTLKNIEIIVIDDCSTDNSYQIAKEYEKKDNRIVLLKNEKNEGVAFTRNRGLEIANGEYIGFVDSDDWVSIDFYEKLYNSAKKGDFDIAKGSRVEVYQDGSQKIENSLNKRIKEGLKKKLPIFCLFEYEFWSAIYKKSLLKENNIRFESYLKSAQDYLFLFFVGIYSKTIIIVDDIFYYYYCQRKGSIYNSRTKSHYERILHLTNIIINTLNSLELNKNIYDISYNLKINHMLRYYEELKSSREFKDFINDFYYKMIEIIFLYKYKESIDFFKLVNFFIVGSEEKQVIKNSKTFDLIKIILKRCIKKIFSLFKNKLEN